MRFVNRWDPWSNPLCLFTGGWIWTPGSSMLALRQCSPFANEELGGILLRIKIGWVIDKFGKFRYKYALPFCQR